MGLSARNSGYYDGSVQRRGFERSVLVIEQFEPAAAREFARVTNAGLKDAAWTGGLLNRTGGPIEFSFGTWSDDLRYTLETGGLGKNEAILRELGEPRTSGGVTSRFSDVQGAGQLKFGASLGVRHTRAGGSFFKTYAEVPVATYGAAEALVGEYLGSAPGPASRLVMLGAAPGSDRCEFYFDLEGRPLTADGLARMLAHVDLESMLPQLLDLAGSFQFRRERGGDLPEAQFGFSYSLMPGGAAAVFSIFAFAADLAGGDGFLRRQVLLSGSGCGWTPRCYAAMTEPVADWYFRSAFHNMISFVAGEGRVGFQVAVSPPPEQPEEE